MSSAASSCSEAEAPSPGAEAEEAAAAAAAAAALLLWERAWSLEEVRAGSQGWSLAADAGLLRFLQEFSQKTLARTHEIKKQMDRLIHETKSTDCRLHNVFNGFLMLSNTQFIENRVYDDEVEEAMPRNEAGDKPEQEKSREQKEADLIPKIQEAVNYGLLVLDSAFEQLDIKAGNSDSEEETTERVELILEPKDLYIDRPLPYLIGSHLFMEQDDVGLGDLSSEEGSVGSDRGSVIESEGKEEEELEEFGDVSEEDQKLRPVLISDEEDYLFGDSEKGEEVEEEGDLEVNAKLKKKRPTSFTDELAARITRDVPESKSKMIVTEKEEVSVPSDDDDIFKSPKLTDEDFLPFASREGLFSGGKGLFDDEESDLFTEVPKEDDVIGKETRIPINDELSSKAKRRVPAGAVSLFPGRNDVFSPSFITEKGDKQLREPIADKVPKLLENSGLFDDDDDDFKPNNENSISAKPSTDLFDAKGDLFKEKPDVASVTNDVLKDAREKKELIIGGKGQPDSSEVSKPLTKTSSKGQISLFSDEEDSEDLLFSNQSRKGNKSASSNKVTTKAQISLFEDENEEELFGSLPKKQVSKPPQEKATGTLFSSDEEDHWNATQEVKPVSESNQTKKSIHAPSAVSHDIKKSLFEEEREEDLFAITKESPRKPQKAVLLFDDDDDDVNGDTLFKFQPPQLSTVDFQKTPQKKLVDEKADFLDGPYMSHGSNLGGGDIVEQQNEKTSLEKNNKRKSKSVFSLFDDEEKNEDVDASKNTQKEKSPVLSAGSKSTGVFQDEELLFVHKLQKDNDPDVDLFACDKKEDPKPRVKLSSEHELFGTDDDGDDILFSSSKTKHLVAEKEPTIIKKAHAISSLKEDNKSSESNQIAKQDDLSSKSTEANLDTTLAILSPTENVKPHPMYPKTPVTQHIKTASVAGSSEETGVSFDCPMQVNTLQNANKSRIKMIGKRRPPTRAARRLAAQDSSKNEDFYESPYLPHSTKDSLQQDAFHPYNNEQHRKENTEKAELFLSNSDQLHETASPILKRTGHLDVDDLFESNNLFANNVSYKASSKSKTIVETESHESKVPIGSGQLPTSLSLDGANCEDLFQPAKQSTKSGSVSLLKDKEDLFTPGKKTVKRKDPKSPVQSEQNPPVQDIFEDDIFASEAMKLPVKAKEVEANLFDDDVDIFADLAEKPKEKSTRKKVETKSIFDEDTDDIFSSSSQSRTSTGKAPSLQTASGTKREFKVSSNFEDPLNAFEGQ